MGNRIRDEMIYNEGQFVRIILTEFNNKIYWIKKINGVITDFKEVGISAEKFSLDGN
jgi:hypothetical protein